MKIERQGPNVVIKDVPIFDEHRDDSRHANLRVVDGTKLSTIFSRSMARLRTEGEFPVAWDDENRHTPRPGEKHRPPPVRGGYRVTRIGDFHGRRAIFADVRVPADDYPAVEAFQRRSVELFPDTLELDTLVLLGSKAPARDLGPLTPRATYARGREVERYEMEDYQMERYDRDAFGVSVEECDTIAATAIEFGVGWDAAKRLNEPIAEPEGPEQYERYGGVERYNALDYVRITDSESRLIATLAEVEKLSWDEARRQVLESR